MFRILLTLFACAAAAVGQYKTQAGGAPPPELAPAVAQTLAKESIKIVDAAGAVLCEIWFRASLPSGGKSSEESVTLPTVPHGALLGVVRYPAQGADRRGQSIKPGIYTLRFSYYPVDGAHQGVAPQRDFLILARASEDSGPSATPAFDPLMELSRKASGTPHPLCLSMWKVDSDFTPGFAKMGEQDWVLQAKIGDTPVAVILIGTYVG